MSNSERLSQTAASIGGGRGIFNEDALYHEVGLQEAVPKLVSILQEEYAVAHGGMIIPDVEFFWKKKIKQKEIIEKVALIDNVPLEEMYQTVNENTFVSPDGGVLFVKYKGIDLPILISEAKKQGTLLFNEDDELRENLTDTQIALALSGKEQVKGNAIERAFKNIEEFKLYCGDLNYFPYVLFACGWDFALDSTIRDRCSAMTRKRPFNVNYVADLPQKVTAYVQEEYFTANEMFEKIYDVAKTSLKCIGV
jgi:type II restriction enzyme